MNNKVIVVAPHADDEILGCGATMARHVKEGDEVYVIIATNASKGAPELFNEEGIEKVRNEALRAHECLGLKGTFFLDFPAPALNAFPEYKISLELSKIFNEIKPDIIYLPHPGDMHQDHKAIYRASLVSARPIGEHKVSNIYCYETLSETDWTPMNEKTFVPNHFIDVSDFFNEKSKAMEFFKSQLRNFPHSRSTEALEALAKFRGSTIGVERAEAFTVERQIKL